MKVIITILIGLLLLTSCSSTKQHFNITTHNPTAMEILSENPNADIFQLKGIIYVNASNIEWVQRMNLSIGKKAGEITKLYKNGISFEDEMATKLLVGVEIFEPVKKSGPILIVKLNNKEIRYLGLIEG